MKNININGFINLKESFIDTAIKNNLINKEEIAILEKAVDMILSNRVIARKIMAYPEVASDYGMSLFAFVDNINNKIYLVQTITGKNMVIVRYDIPVIPGLNDDTDNTKKFEFVSFRKGSLYLCSDNCSVAFFKTVLKDAILHNINKSMEVVN